MPNDNAPSPVTPQRHEGESREEQMRDSAGQTGTDLANTEQRISPQDDANSRSSVSPKELRDAAEALVFGEWYGHAATVRFAADQLERQERALAERDELEYELRRTLWLNHGHQGLYGDDGEMQCNMGGCMIDFKRLPWKEILERLYVQRLREAQVALADMGEGPRT